MLQLCNDSRNHANSTPDARRRDGWCPKHACLPRTHGVPELEGRATMHRLVSCLRSPESSTPQFALRLASSLARCCCECRREPQWVPALQSCVQRASPRRRDAVSRTPSRVHRCARPRAVFAPTAAGRSVAARKALFLGVGDRLWTCASVRIYSLFAERLLVRDASVP